MIRKKSIGIHDGSFHADEVTACALLLLYDLIDEDKIIRTRDPLILSECEYVCDVGGVYDVGIKRFDHHQSDYKGEASSAGMILDYLKMKGYLSAEEHVFLNSILIHGIDEQDNGRVFSADGYCSFSDIIKIYNFCDEDNPSMTAFYTALHFTLDLLKRLRDKFAYMTSCKRKIQEVMNQSSMYLTFDSPLPWLDNFFSLGGDKHPALFVIFPSGGQWILRGIPPNKDRKMDVRVPFPKSWAGLLGNDLKKVCGIDGAVFCHKGRFISVWRSFKDCLQALKSTLKSNGIDYGNDL
ncbi:MAG: MYG1 family protein [Victivallaceae bacterium]